MTRKEAIQIFNEVLLFGKAQCTQAEFKELAKMSIKALGQEPKSEWEQDHAILKAYSDGVNETLDKIRAEIVDLGQRTMNDNRASGIWACRDIIDKYKAESEG